MAEFCVDCWNKLIGENLSANKYILSKEAEFCEECGQCKKSYHYGEEILLSTKVQKTLKICRYSMSNTFAALPFI